MHVGDQPACCFGETLAAERVQAPLPVDAALDHAGIPEDAQVARGVGLAETGQRDDVTDGLLSAEQMVEYLSAGRLGEHLEA